MPYNQGVVEVRHDCEKEVKNFEDLVESTKRRHLMQRQERAKAMSTLASNHVVEETKEKIELDTLETQLEQARQRLAAARTGEGHESLPRGPTTTIRESQESWHGQSDEDEDEVVLAPSAKRARRTLARGSRYQLPRVDTEEAEDDDLCMIPVHEGSEAIDEGPVDSIPLFQRTPRPYHFGRDSAPWKESQEPREGENNDGTIVPKVNALMSYHLSLLGAPSPPQQSTSHEAERQLSMPWSKQGLMLGVYRCSPESPEHQHVVVGFFDTRGYLRRRVMKYDRSGRQLQCGDVNHMTFVGPDTMELHPRFRGMSDDRLRAEVRRHQELNASRAGSQQRGTRSEGRAMKAEA